jgi:amino acid transporter/nucleotide-binding universal stress UspA family protein
MSWFSHSVACSLYGLGFGAYFAQLLHSFDLGLPYLSEAVEVKVLAVLVIVVFTAINLRGSAETGRAGNVITLGQMLVLGVFVVAGLWALRGEPQWPQKFTPFLPAGIPGLLMAMGLTFVAFEGYEIIAQCGEEVRRPKRNIPRAIFLAVGIVVPVYVLIALVMLAASRAPEGTPVWQYLGGHAELAVLEAARQFAPGGIALLLLGGLFATTSALNATLYSSSRVSFAMGRDYNLPDVFAQVHRSRRTPHGAILFSSVIIALAAVALPLEAVASATDITFMCLFAMINLSLIALRYQRPDVKRGFAVPLCPWLPLASTVALLFLAGYLFEFSRTAWYVTAGWIALGLIVFREYAGKREREETGGKALLEERTIEPIQDAVLVAVANPNTVGPLMHVGCAIARERETAVIALHVIKVPAQLPRSEGRRFLERAEPLLDSAVEIGEKLNTSVYSALWVSSDLHKGVLEVIAEKRPSLVLMGWRGYTRARARFFGTTLDPVLLGAQTDVALLRWRNTKAETKTTIKNVVVGVTGSEHSMLAIEIARGLENQLSTSTRYLHIIKRGTAMDAATEEKFLGEYADASPALDLDLVQAKSSADGIVEASKKADLLIIGGAREGILSQIVVGEKTRSVARRARCAVLMARHRAGPARSLLRRLFTKQA